ncbi:MAG: Rpn family recombination-promoting nuclease/putative transposase [Pseudomonadota bacterium]
MAGHHDLGYKLLFAHPELVRDLVAGFTPLGAVAEFDASAFERVNPVYVSDQFAEREDDIVWRVKLGEQWLYIYILLEFQSGIDRWMALRMQVYIGLLYQDLVKRAELSPATLLPPVLPIVLYNGRASWSASLDLGALIMPAPAGLVGLQASQHYLVIELHKLDPTMLADMRSVISLLFQMELSQEPDVTSDVLSTLATWLRDDARASLRRDVISWVERMMNSQFESVSETVPEHADVDRMVKKFNTWADEFENRGLQKGLKKGVAQGVAQGREEGSSVLRSVLQKLLASQFQDFPADVATRIAQAPMAQLQAWLEQVIDGKNIDDLFGPQRGAT